MAHARCMLDNSGLQTDTQNMYYLLLFHGNSGYANVPQYYIIQGVPGGKVNILGGYSIGHSKQETLYEHVSYSERFPR